MNTSKRNWLGFELISPSNPRATPVNGGFVTSLATSRTAFTANSPAVMTGGRGGPLCSADPPKRGGTEWHLRRTPAPQELSARVMC
ncbi:hypothetical protein VZT92_017026 [Zoarces viviparus]|uniref:Uncharacterized protein n=1 Tax=Zoarces viviparus TaxID=48416 RepID=A0AAW1EQ01_ZOAVI